MPTSRRIPLAVALALALLGSGCGTLDNVNRPTHPPPGNPEAPVCRVYGGVRGDWALISEYPLSQTTVYADYVAIPVLAGINLFFSAVGDTITLPYTIVEELRRAFGRGARSSEFAPVVMPGTTMPAAPPPNASPDVAASPATGAPPAPISPQGYFSTVNR
jgi:uncharacterized protein YceK